MIGTLPTSLTWESKSSDSQDLQDFAEILLDFFLRDAQSTNRLERSLKVAGQSFKLSFAENFKPDQLLRAISHFETHGAPDGFTLYVQDCVQSGQTLPNFPGKAKLLRGSHQNAPNSDHLLEYVADEKSLTFLSRAEGFGVFWALDAEKLPIHDLAAPVKSLFHVLLRANNRQMIHGGVIGLKDSACLIVGKSGSGKSTTILSCLSKAFSCGGDDYTLVERMVNGTHTAHNLYNTAKVTPDGLSRFPWLQSSITARQQAPTNKSLLYLDQEAGYDFRTNHVLVALVHPHIVGTGPTYASKMNVAEMVRAIAPNTLLQLPGCDKKDLGFICRMASKVPGYRLMIGSDDRKIPDVIKEIIGESLENLHE